MKGIIFDYGNTLAISASLTDSLKQVLKNEKAEAIGIEIEAHLASLYQPDQKIQPFWGDVWASAFAKFGVAYSEEVAISHLKHFMLSCKLYSYTIELLTDLKTAGYRLGLLSNVTGPTHIFHNDIKNKGISPFFDSVVWSCETGYRKPSKKVFQIALEKLKLNHTEVIMVGDNEMADIEGAMKLGIKTVRVYDGNKPENSAADYLIDRREFATGLKDIVNK